MQIQFKAFTSLEAYNQMLSGFIASVRAHCRKEVRVFGKGSQRMNDALIPF